MDQLTLSPALLSIAVPALALLTLALFTMDLTPMRKKLGADSLPSPLFELAALFWAALFLSLFAGLLHLIWSVLLAGIDIDAPTFRFQLANLAGLTAVFGAVVALPFTVVRLRLSAEQNQQAKDSLFNEKLSQALSGLHARRLRTIKSESAQGGYVDTWEDDVIQREVAIHLLQELSRERPDFNNRITETLGVYLTEVSKARKTSEKTGSSLNTTRQPEVVSLPPELRGDLEKVLKHITAPKSPGANLTGANLSEARLEGANLQRARLRRANLSSITIDEKTDWAGADVSLAALKGIDFSKSNISQSEIASAFGDASTVLPDHFSRPSHWPDQDLSTPDFATEWSLYKSDPTSYIPPQDRKDA